MLGIAVLKVGEGSHTGNKLGSWMRGSAISLPQGSMQGCGMRCYTSIIHKSHLLKVHHLQTSVKFVPSDLIPDKFFKNGYRQWCDFSEVISLDAVSFEPLLSQFLLEIYGPGLVSLSCNMAVLEWCLERSIQNNAEETLQYVYVCNCDFGYGYSDLILFCC